MKKITSFLCACLFGVGCGDEHSSLDRNMPDGRTTLYVSNAGLFATPTETTLAFAVDEAGQIKVNSGGFDGRTLTLLIDGQTIEQRAMQPNLVFDYNFVENQQSPYSALVEVRMSGVDMDTLGVVCADDDCFYTTGQHQLMMSKTPLMGLPQTLGDDCPASNVVCVTSTTLSPGTYKVPFYCPKGFKNKVQLNTTSGRTTLSVTDRQGNTYGTSSSLGNVDELLFFARSVTNDCVAQIEVTKKATVEFEAKALKTSSTMANLIAQARAGDILLFAKPPGEPCDLEPILRDGIHKFTRQTIPEGIMHYCHAALVVSSEPFLAIDAPGPGESVRTFGANVSPMVSTTYNEVVLLHVDTDESNKQKVVAHAMNQIGVPYGFVGNTLYCSELVDQAYRSAGVRLHKNWMQVGIFPDDLISSNKASVLMSVRKSFKRARTTTTTTPAEPTFVANTAVLTWPFSTTEWKDVPGSWAHKCSDRLSRDYNSTKGAGNIELDRTQVDSRLFAVFNGRVIFAGVSPNDPGRGYQVVLESSSEKGLIASYAHLVPFDVDMLIGKTFSAGDDLGVFVGNTGTRSAHLHFSLWRGVVDGKALERVLNGQTPEGYSCDFSSFSIPYRFDLSSFAINPCTMLSDGAYCADNGPHLSLYEGDASDLITCKNQEVAQTQPCTSCVRRVQGEPDECSDEEPVQCVDACPQLNDQKCSGNGYRTCQRDAQGCLIWSRVNSCGDGMCNDGQCVQSQGCTDNCPNEGARTCNSSSKYRLCVRNADGCLQWSGLNNCPVDTSCETTTGRCQSNPSQCNHQCTAGEKVCSGNGYRVCQRDASNCLIWSRVEPCLNGTTCNAGQCQGNQPQCSGGPCCNNGSYRSSSFVCNTVTSYRCASNNCGGDAQIKVEEQYCSGSSSTCDGQSVTGSWQDIDNCSSSEKCTATTNSASCYSANECSSCTASKYWSPDSTKGAAPSGKQRTTTLNVKLEFELQDANSSGKAQFRVCKYDGSGNASNFTNGQIHVHYVNQHAPNHDTTMYEGSVNTGSSSNCTSWTEINHTFNTGQKVGGMARIVSPASSATKWGNQCGGPSGSSAGTCWFVADTGSMTRTCK